MTQDTTELDASMPSLFGSARLIQQKLTGLPSSKNNIPQIMQLTELLPPIHLAGFEYQLGSPGRGLDFQQGFRINRESLFALNQFCRNTTSPEHPHLEIISSVRDLIDRCMGGQAKGVHPIRQVWLEYDTGLGLQRSPAAIFITLRDELMDPEIIGSELSNTYQQFAGAEIDPDTYKTASAIFNSAVAFRGVSSIGFMAGRPGGGIRIILPIDCSGDLEKLIRIVDPLLPASEMASSIKFFEPELPACRLCVDVQPKQTGGIALECAFPEYTNGLPYRKNSNCLFTKLISKGWCSEAEAGTLLNWPEEIYPPDNSQCWPDDLIIQSLRFPEDHFHHIQCGFSHLKLADWRTDWQVRKIYFGYRAAVRISSPEGLGLEPNFSVR